MNSEFHNTMFYQFTEDLAPKLEVISGSSLFFFTSGPTQTLAHTSRRAFFLVCRPNEQQLFFHGILFSSLNSHSRDVLFNKYDSVILCVCVCVCVCVYVLCVCVCVFMCVCVYCFCIFV